MLVEADSIQTVVGIGGSRAALIQNDLRAGDFPTHGGITGHVFDTGEPLLVNNTSIERRYIPLRGWDAGSELCVPLKDGDRVMGFIDVESSQQNAFTHNDLLALLSLAGVLAAVVSSANQYERLQETIHQLQTAQVEIAGSVNSPARGRKPISAGC